MTSSFDPAESVTQPQVEAQSSVQEDDASESQNDGNATLYSEVASEPLSDNVVRLQPGSAEQTQANAASSSRLVSSSTMRGDLTSAAQKRTTQAHEERQTTLSPAAEAQTKLRQTVNDSYGQSLQSGVSGTTADLSEEYRTEDSYTLEEDALRAARSLFAQTLASPDSLNVIETRVTDCADDGDNVYYRIFMRVSYRVQTGEEIRRGVFQSVGIRKKDRSTFDASADIRDVLDAYSIYAPTVRKTQAECDPASPDYAAAAQQIALAQLKHPASGAFRSSTSHTEASDSEAGYVIYDVVCVGRNDYGMQIPGVYTVYMVLEDGTIRQVDPTAE